MCFFRIRSKENVNSGFSGIERTVLNTELFLLWKIRGKISISEEHNGHFLGKRTSNHNAPRGKRSSLLVYIFKNNSVLD